MKTRSTFEINYENISKGVEKIFDKFNKSTVRIVSKSGDEYLAIPLIIAIIITCIFPIFVVIGILIARLFNFNFICEQKIETPDEIKH